MRKELLLPPGHRIKLGSKPGSVHVPCFNASTEIAVGAIVILDITNTLASGQLYVATTTTVGHPLTLGVTASKIPASAASKGFVCVHGPAEVALKGATVNVAAGDFVTTGATAGYGYKANLIGVRCVGVAKDAKAADSVLGTTSGYATVYVDTSLVSGYPGTSSANFSSATADINFSQLYVTSSATSGTTRGNYTRLYLTGGAGGEAARLFTTVSSNTPADTVNGAHISLSFGASAGNVTGLGTAVRATAHVPNRSLGGTVGAVQAELYADGASSAVGGTLSLIRAVIDGEATGKAAVEDGAFLLDVSTGSNASGNVVGALNGNEPTWASHTGLIRVNLNGTTAYLVAVTL